MPPKKRVQGQIQAIIFNKKAVDTRTARRWIKRFGLKRIKRVDKSERGSLRYRIRPPGKFRSFRRKKLSKNVEVVMGSHPRK